MSSTGYMICSPQDILGHPQDIPHRIKYILWGTYGGYTLWMTMLYPVDDISYILWRTCIISCGGNDVYPVDDMPCPPQDI